MKVKSSIAVVTGANRGIGRALVKALLDAGAAKVYAGARDPSKLGPVLSLDAARVAPLKLDVTSPADIAAAALSAKDATLLVNNAGVLEDGSALDLERAAFERVFNVNFYGLLATSKAFAPVIEKNGGGGIVNVLSIVSFASMPGFSAYNASKAAAWSLTQSLRAQLAAKKIEVLAVFPGPIDTDMAAGVDIPKTSAEATAKAIVAGVEEGREDILPDPMAQQTYAAWTQDHKAVEKQFGAM
ncbi:MAG TPA: SDR family oxidoreductase [Methylocystis sp.]|nr:SDR family oxidoreductase [Methylocystis sp.]